MLSGSRVIELVLERQVFIGTHQCAIEQGQEHN